MSHHDAHGHGAHEAPHPHVLPLALYWGVFGVLLALTGLTVAVIKVDLGVFNIVVAMAIAVVKAVLVCAIFMHLWWDDRLNTVIMAACMLFVAVFIMFCLMDMQSRDMVDPIKRNYLIRDQKVQQYNEQNPGAFPMRAYKDDWWKAPDPAKLKAIQPGH